VTDCFRDPPTPARAAVDVSAPDGVRLRRWTSGGVHYVTLTVAEGTRLERVVAHLTGEDPRAVFVSATSGRPAELLFRVDDPGRVEASGSFAGFVSGGMSNVPVSPRLGW
jgi:hypothetical protein